MKRILSFVLSLCLIVGLLPAVAVPAFADVTTKVVTLMVDTDQQIELSATNDGETVTYTKNKEVTFTDSSGASFTGWAQEIVNVTNEETDEWNVKFYYDATAKRYKLVLKGARLDAYNNETNKPVSGSKAIATHTSASKYSFYLYVEVHQDSYMEAERGIYNNVGGAYKWDQVSIESKNDATLYMQTNSYGIYSQKSIVLNANIVADTNKNSFAYLNVAGYKITVNGGHLQFSDVYRAFNDGSSVTTNSVVLNGGKITGTFSNKFSDIAFTANEDLCCTVTDGSGNALTLDTMGASKTVNFNSSTEHMDVVTSETVTQAPTCGTAGSKDVYSYCNACSKVISEGAQEIPATGEHNYDKTTGYCECGAYEEPDAPIEGPVWPEDVTFATAEQMANVVLEKKASAGGAMTAHPGGKITYKLSITNNNAEAINVHVEDMIPKGTKLLDGCDYTSGRALYWVEKDIAPGETRVITYNVKPDYTLAEVRASETDIVLTNTEAKVMDVTVPAPAKDIYVLETFNAEDIRKMEMAIDALVTANLTAKYSNVPLNRIQLAAMIYNVAFTVGAGLGTTDPDEIFTLVFDKAGETGSGSTSGGVEDVVDKGQDLLDRVPPHLYGGTAISADKDELFRGERATEVTINDLISGDLIFVNSSGETKLYIVDGAKLVWLGETEVVRAIDPATVLPGLTTSDKYVVIRPSINLNITFSLQEGEYFNAADAEGYTDVEKAIVATAETYLLRGDRAQYTDDMTGTSLNRAEAGYKQPEDYTVDQYGYTNCAFFTYDVHVMTHGYKPYGNSTSLNTTANNAAYAKKYWDFETGTSSSKGVIYYAEPMQKDDSGTYVSTLTDAEKAAMKEQIISLLRPGDIINIRRTTGSGHAMLYVGNGTIIHSSGSNYSSTNKTDTHEATIRFRMVEDLFDPAIYNETSCVYNLASFALIRPTAMTSNGATENAANRINNMQGIIGEKISSTAMGKTVNCGDEITYTFYVFNTNAEDRAITINDVLSEYVTFVSATNGGTCEGGNVSWKFTVTADTRMSVSYTVKVNDGLTHYTAIDGSRATINGVSHKCIDTYVANTLSAEQQQTLIEAVNKVKEMDVSGLNGVEIANLIYKEAFGIEKIFGEKITNMAELINGDTDNDSSTKGVDNIGIFNDTWYWESSNKTSVAWMPGYNTSVAAQMVAPGMYGGQLVYQSSYNKNNRDERQNRYLNVGDSTLRSRYFWEKDLVVGDLFVMATLSSQRSLYIYVGNDTFVSIGEGFTVFTEQSVSARFQYAPASTWKFLAVLRPSFAFEDAHNVVELPAVESSCTAAGTTAGKECADCGVHLVEPLTVAALGHSYDNDFDTECNVCGETREVEEGLTVTAENKLLLADTDETHINHRVVVYFLGDQTVADITDEAALKEIDPDAATYWKASQINAKVLSESGNYVLAYSYNDTEENGKKVTIYIEASVIASEVIAPTIDVEFNKLVATAGDENCVNYRATVYYLGNQAAEDINDVDALKAKAATVKTYWGLDDINKTQLLESGNYVIHLDYNVGTGAKQTVVKAVTLEFSEMTLNVVNGQLVAADPENAYIHHRAVVYYLGDATVEDIEDEAAVSAAAVSATTYWKLTYINKTKLTESGNYVVMLHYNLPGSPKMTVAVSVTI